MKIKDLLKIQSIVEGKAIPSDLLNIAITYYSKSKDEEIRIEDLHLNHFIRIFIKLLEEDRFLIDEKNESYNNFKHQVNDYEKQKLKEIFNDFFDKLNEKRH